MEGGRWLIRSWQGNRETFLIDAILGHIQGMMGRLCNHRQSGELGGRAEWTGSQDEVEVEVEVEVEIEIEIELR